MRWYEVSVEDHLTHAVCVVGQMLTISEARSLRTYIEKYGACKVTVKEFTFLRKKGKEIR